MVYGAILEKGERCYTYISRIFSAFEDVLLRHNWLITDWETNPCIREFDEACTDGNYLWFTGSELADILHKYDSFQWIWGVLSAFEPDVTFEEVLKYPLPYADGNVMLWKNPPSLQHPLSLTEIVPFDSSLVLVVSKDSDVIRRFRERFPLSEDLAEYNKK